MEEYYKFVLEYLILRQAWNMDFIPFNCFKQIISYATGIHNIYYLRKIFVHLVDKGFFIKRRNEKRSYSYRFIGPGDNLPLVKF